MSPLPNRKLALGTVQFGVPYGIANKTGVPADATIREILDRAEKCGVFMLDTAPVYGESELILGRLIGANAGFRIVSKTLPLHAAAISRDEVDAVARTFEVSLQHLNRRKLYGLLVHHAENLLVPGGDKLWEWMASIASSGLVERIGVSVYSPDQLSAVLNRYPIQIVQLPLSIYDQRFVRSGLLEFLKDRGVEIHARSAFLQGLLLMAPGELPNQFASIRQHQARLHAWLHDRGMTPLIGAIAFSLNDPRTDYVVFGCDNVQQFTEVVNSIDRSHTCAGVEQFVIENIDVINPKRWKDPA